MQISIAPLRIEDARAVVDAEDEHTIHWLSGGESTVEGTAAYIAQLVHDAENGKAKRAFGIWLDGRCVGTVDYDPDVTDGLEPGDVNVAYGVAPEARGRGVAVRAVDLVCDQILERGVGRRAVIRADAQNHASTRVAEKAGFTFLRDIRIASVAGEGGEPEILRVYGRELA
ncbi:hypothetical protein GCM10028787_29820 [Brachybacterium horti]